MSSTQILENAERHLGRTPRWLSSYGPAALVTVTSIVLAARLFRLISRYAVNIFFSDQWDFNDATLFQKHSIWQMFAWQHGPHRQGLGALFEKLVDPLFRWNSRIESFVVGGVIVAAAICALLLKKRLYGSFSISDIAIPAIFFTPGQYQALCVTANFSHGPFPLLLIVLYCLAWTCSRSALRYPLVLLINFMTIYTGFGLFLGVLTPVLLVLDRWASTPNSRLPRAYFVGSLIVSVASLGSFFVGYKFTAAIDCFSFQPQPPQSYVAYMAIMFSHFLALTGTGIFPWAVGVTMLGALSITLAIVVWQLLRRSTTPVPDSQKQRAVVVATLIAYCVLFCLNTAYGRLCGGLWAAQASRYVNYLELGFLGLYFHLLSVRRPSIRRWLLSLFLAPVVLASLHVDRGGMAHYRDGRQRWKTCYLRTEDINLCNEAVRFAVYPWRSELPHLQEKLQYLKKTRQNLYSDSLGDKPSSSAAPK
jgi:hypothetical protein